MKKTFFLTLLLGAFAYCRQPEPQPQRNLQLYVRYLAPETQLRVEATLEENLPGQTPQKVEIPGGIRYQDYPLQIVRLQGTQYLFERKRDYDPDHIFTWKTPEGQSGKFSATIPAFDDFGFEFQKLERNTPARFAWKGAPLGQGEALAFVWERIGDGKTVTMDILSIGQQPEIEFPAAKIAELEPGRWSMYVVRRQLQKTTVEGLPVSAVFEYYSHTDTLLVE